MRKSANKNCHIFYLFLRIQNCTTIKEIFKKNLKTNCQMEIFSHNNGNIKDFRQFSFITVETTLIKIYGPKKPLIIFVWVIPL